MKALRIKTAVFCDMKPYIFVYVDYQIVLATSRKTILIIIIIIIIIIIRNLPVT